MPLLRNSHSNSDQQEGYPKKAHGSTAPTWPTGYYFVTMLTCWGGGGGWGSPLLQNAGNAEVETAMLTCVCVGGGGPGESGFTQNSPAKTSEHNWNHSPF